MPSGLGKLFLLGKNLVPVLSGLRMQNLNSGPSGVSAELVRAWSELRVQVEGAHLSNFQLKLQGVNPTPES